MKTQHMIESNRINAKYMTYNADQVNTHLQEIERIGLTMKMLCPNTMMRDTQKQQPSINIKHKNNEISCIFFQSLHMDLTPYQTLKQLIIQNKQLAKESQSAYFLSKQSQKLINFIDGWTKLSRNTYNQKDFVFIEEAQRMGTSHKRKGSANQALSQTVHRQEERERVRMRVKKQQRVRKQGEEELKKVELIMERKAEAVKQKKRVNSAQQSSCHQFQAQKRKSMQKLSSMPALIVEEQQLQTFRRGRQQLHRHQQQNIQVQIQSVSPQEHYDDENNMNNSNLIVEQCRDSNHKEMKKCINKYEKCNKLYQQPSTHKFNYTGNAQQQHLNEIIRPEYQKTEVSLSPCQSSLNESSQLYQNNPTLNETQVKNKKTIPLLKKNTKQQTVISYSKESKVTYNQVVGKRNNNQKVLNSEEITLKKAEEEMAREKGFISEDTDANSRLTVFTNKGKMIGMNDELRSLSPKVEGRRKLVKLSSSTNPNANVKSNVSQKQTVSKKGSEIQQVIAEDKSSQQSLNSRDQQPPRKSGNMKGGVQMKTSFYQQHHHHQQQLSDSSNLQKELKQLEDEFMNRNMRKSLQQQSSSQQFNSQQQYNNSDNKMEQRQFEQEFSKSLTSTNRQNKTLQFIKKHQRSSTMLSNITNPHRQLNSIVVQQQPWQCDQLQLEEELKAIDEKILERKSILSNQLPNYNHNDSNSTNQIPTNSHQQQESRSNLIQHHQRTRTTNNQQIDHKKFYHNYSPNLFQLNQPFHEQLQTQHPNANHQPKVVKLSLNALAQNLNKKSRQSNQNHHHHQLQKNTSQTKLHHQPSQSKLQRQPSCKSIFLIEEAQKRGISPSKSNRSIKSRNQQVKQLSKTQRNIVKKKFLQNEKNFDEVMNICESESVRHLWDRTPSPIERNNRSSTPQNRGSQRVNNFTSMLQNVQNNNNKKPIKHNYHQESSSNSRTFSEMIESEYELAKRNGYGEKVMVNCKLNDIAQHLSRENDNNNKDHSILSNCERYFYKNDEESQTSLYAEDYGKLATNKWGQLEKKNDKKSGSPSRKKRMILLSDQLRGE